ncbi:MAG: Hsp70 family protein [Synergistaceae bacterium]|jgi:molecular chaperone DnaK|nr:Hsp70 family protein [Synergistaceae bacterium]
MKNFVGIDLGTTNSAIFSYDGTQTRIWKSPEQNDVTPSAIYIDRRSKYVGKRAYDLAPWHPGNCVTLFKRFMGTKTLFYLRVPNLTKTPEECSTEVLKALFGSLSEEIRNDPDVGTVITVPAVFDQMQKDATMQAAEMAGIGKVALMQEPVAAVMSVMRARKSDGTFLVYDLGGGTLDIAVAESTGGRVSLLAHDGIALCGGRDFDRAICDNIVFPWLKENFAVPDDFRANPLFKTLPHIAAWGAERAKIELSSNEEAVISLSEAEVRVRDLDGKDIYFEVPLRRSVYDKLIAQHVDDSVKTARETLEKAGLPLQDLGRIVFIGGPTNYKPLRDKVTSELRVEGGLDVNPMTAVAEGASLFAEAIDWSTRNRSRKNVRGQISSGGKLALSFDFIARTPGVKSKITIRSTGVSGFEIQLDSLDTGWSSGRLPLEQEAAFDVPLVKEGENTFKVFAYDTLGSPVAMEQDRITITRTAATVDAIPASHSVGLELLEKLGGKPKLMYLVRAGDVLPKKGKLKCLAGELIKAGSSNALKFKVWEGEIEDPIGDNRYIGVFKICGTDFDDGVIPVGAEIEFDYEVLDSGLITVEASVPAIGATFSSSQNCYSRLEGQIDYSLDSDEAFEKAENILSRIDEINESVDDQRLEQAREKLDFALSLNPDEASAEERREAAEKNKEALDILAKIRLEHKKEIRQIDLDGVVALFNEHLRQHAAPMETSAFDRLTKIAQRAIDKNDKDFDERLDKLKGKNFEILWRQDWFVVNAFKNMGKSPYRFADRVQFGKLLETGAQCLLSDDIEGLRGVVAQLWQIQRVEAGDGAALDVVNIIKG